jgi:E3 ubiquitin-protein ligase UBR2
LSIENKEELPSHIKPDTLNDDYVTMLYNDEVHSYEQVVSTLRKVLSIDEKKAYEYAAIVDKEGRSTIRRAKKSRMHSDQDKSGNDNGRPVE